jgi:hypothetical protein
MRPKIGAPPGERHGMAKMTDRKVRELREWYDEGGISILDIATEFDIAYSTARAIINRESWQHVPDRPKTPCEHCEGRGYKWQPMVGT